jgi:shikimate dehydrogenase
MLIEGTTRLVGLLGDPVSHSRSPRMQNAAFAALGLDLAYVPLRVDAARLDAALAGLVALSFVGANVTIPHKEAVAARCASLTAVARGAGSVNTLLVAGDGTLEGDSTDGAAVVGALEAALGGPVAGRDALVLGAGGSARAAAAALASAGARVAITARRPAAAAALAEALAPLGDVAAAPAGAAPAEIVVHCTPLGGASALQESPLPADALGDVRVVCDLAYRPDAQPTVLCRDAAAAGCAVVDGLEVLARQGALSFVRFTGRDAPLDVMRAAARG